MGKTAYPFYLTFIFTSTSYILQRYNICNLGKGSSEHRNRMDLKYLKMCCNLIENGEGVEFVLIFMVVFKNS